MEAAKARGPVGDARTDASCRPRRDWSGIVVGQAGPDDPVDLKNTSRNARHPAQSRG